MCKHDTQNTHLAFHYEQEIIRNFKWQLAIFHFVTVFKSVVPPYYKIIWSSS